ncbi:response regulator transcription factor [Aquamicrobium sp. LC103]|uniref:winged helix-turn-helix transcriptional regulator n=1 Tax=Aquamicrobium sp. LC103 TaxID=1120658 RepID=UPI00063E99B2|nr:response regulator transcription factor [Aquamicrobium sp. LC103]TKT75667.1 response regulator [Aquamicrobium sp. LC103]
MKPLIFVCSQDAWSYLVFSHILKADGFEVELAQDADEVIALAAEKAAAAIILDCGTDLPEAPDICKRLKGEAVTEDIPIIASLPGDLADKHMELLKAGVAQSFVRPFDPGQLLSYLRMAVYPGEGTSPVSKMLDDVFRFDKLELFPRKHRVRYDGKEVALRQLEFRLLCVMMLDPGKVFGRDELIETAWPDNIHVELRTVDVHIGRLRHALVKATGKNMIRTVRSAGYALDANAEA